jgi:hypothetical protein
LGKTGHLTASARSNRRFDFADRAGRAAAERECARRQAKNRRKNRALFGNRGKPFLFR